MKIIHVTQFLGIGGLEKIICQLALEQQKRGHEVSIYVYDYEQSWVEYFRSLGLEVITPEVKKPGYDFSLFKTFKKDLFNADIIHTHDINPLMYLSPLYFAHSLVRKKLPKLIHTAHGMDHVDHYPRARTYEKLVSKIPDHIIGVSDKIGSFYREVCHLPKSKVSVIQNGISLYENVVSAETKMNKKRELCQKFNLDPSLPLFLALSRVTPLKDQKFLMKALAKRPQCQLLVVGPASDPDYYKKLADLQTDQIKLIGPQSAVNDFNLASDLYLSASTHEGIPVAVLEAMAVETPCLISDIVGHQVLNKYSHCVDLYPIGNESAFLTMIDQFLGHQLVSKASTAREIVEKYFSVKNMVDQYIEVYQ